jgi:hypothetical protein
VNPWPITPLGTKDLNFSAVNYDFTGLTASELAPLPGLESAIDASLIEAAASVADQAVLIASMAGDLDDLGIVLNEMGSDDFQSVLGDLAGAASAGDSLLSGFTSLFVAPSPAPAPGPAPAPTPGPSPTPIGGGGSSGGGAGSGGGTGGVAIPPEAPPGFEPGGRGTIIRLV